MKFLGIIPIMFLFLLRIGKEWCPDSRATKTLSRVSTLSRVTTSFVIICSAMIYLQGRGTKSRRIGICFPLTPLSYKPRVKIAPTLLEMMTVKKIGTNRLIVCEVSIMITASENVIRVYPARTAAVPSTVKFLMSFSSTEGLSINFHWQISFPMKVPRAQPRIIPGKKRPAGTLVPQVMQVKKYQTKKKTTICQISVSTYLLINEVMI